MEAKLRICMLNADVPVPAVFSHRAPTYGRIFHELIAKVSPNVTIASEDFDVTQFEYPISIDEFDAIVISGSANSSYDDIPWIHRLDDYVREVYTNHPQVKIFGSCFGHQLMCQSLLKEYGVKVEADPNGWEIGVKEITLHQKFREVFRRHTNTQHELDGKMRLQFVHHDHVVIPQPDALPSQWTTLGNTEHCAVQGIYEPGRILTLQGHFEFDRFVNSETIKSFFASWDKDVLQAALNDTDADDDWECAARIVLYFFLSEGVGASFAPRVGIAHEIGTGLEGEHQVAVSVKS